MTASRPLRLRWIIGGLLWLLVTIPVSAGVGVLAFYELDHADRIYEGVRVGKVAVGGLRIEAAALAIQAGYTPYPGRPIIVRYGERWWDLMPEADLGLGVDAQGAALAAYGVGRQGASAGTTVTPQTLWEGVRGDLAAQWTAWRSGTVITPTLSFDENRLALALKRIAREVDVPVREGQIAITGLEVTAVPGANGQAVDLEATRERLLPLIWAGGGGAVDLVVTPREPVVRSVEAAAAKARSLLSLPLTLVAPGAETMQRVTVEREQLRSWLRFAPSAPQDGSLGLAVQLDIRQVTGDLEKLARVFDRPAQDANLDFDPARNQLVVLKPSVLGQTLDVNTGAAIISATLQGLSQGDASASREIMLPVKLITPTIHSARLADLGIVELVSEGTTNFAGSSRERVQNIVAAANRFRNVVVPPGAEFSFNEHVGEINAESGFVDSYIIWGDRTAVGIGGGVCQVSTTAFRAAFYGGFPITERWAHGYVVSWYGEPGLDATIFTPWVDLRFRNDTGKFLLIKASVDTARSSIAFRFYGTKPARTVEMDKPEISNTRAPEGPIYQEDLTLAAGVLKQVEWARNGMDVVITRRVRTADGQVREDVFRSEYQPWRSLFLVGPGVPVPEGAKIVPVATPTPTPRP